MRENAGKMRTRITPNTDSFYAVLDLIEQNWNPKCKGDESIYSEDVSNVSHSDAQQVLKDIRKSNVNKLVFGQLNIN